MQWITDSYGANKAEDKGVRFSIGEMPESDPERRWHWQVGTTASPSITISDFAPSREEAEAFALAAAPVVRTASAELELAIETMKARAVAGLRVVA